VISAAIAAAAILAGCGGGSRQDANEPSANFPVQVASATFPTSQRLSQHSHLVISIRNVGTRTIPDIAITICPITCTYNAKTGYPTGGGVDAQAFGEDLSMPYLANPSRPVWIVDRPPGLCGYSCKSGGPGSAVTAYTNTWALGPLKPGAIATFDWGVTAVQPGTHIVAWEVAAGLNGKARAVLPGGGNAPPGGTFRVSVSNQPQQSYVSDGGKIIVSK